MLAPVLGADHTQRAGEREPVDMEDAGQPSGQAFAWFGCPDDGSAHGDDEPGGVLPLKVFVSRLDDGRFLQSWPTG